ncbi:MAG: hypothetical protein HQ527_00095 [Cyanobacteria bacterium]|nr:hypothetical protein [Cyanobacteria bacterium bin.51]
MVFTLSLRSPAPAVLAAGVLALGLTVPAEALAGSRSWQNRTRIQPVSRQLAGFRQLPVYRQEPVDRRVQIVPSRVIQAPVSLARNFPAPYQDYPNQRINTAPYQQGQGSWQDAQNLQQRCSIGRLVGGVLGGGLGYAASRQDGRTWAVPLGALLGSQVGCNAGQGRDPLPW